MARPPVGTVEIGLPHQGRERTYLLRARPGLRGPVPLLLELHGRGIDPVMFDRWTGYSALADQEGFVLAMPLASGEVWNDGRYSSRWPDRDGVDDVGYLLAVIDDVARRQQVDLTRVYLVGMSNGATMAGRFVWAHPDRVAAIAQVAGTVAAGVVAGRVPARPVPVLEIHGTRDRIAPYGGGRAPTWMRLFTRRPIDPVLGVDEWARRLVERNAAMDGPQVEALAPDVTVRRWRGPSPASDVVFYRVDGGGHTWPGARTWMPPHLGRVSQSFDATRVSWEFLAAHRRAT